MAAKGIQGLISGNCNVALYGKRDFADIRLLRWDYQPELSRWALSVIELSQKKEGEKYDTEERRQSHNLSREI